VVDQHPHLGPELGQLAQTILGMLDPLIQAVLALAPPADGEPGKCQQVWCPVCAMSAVSAGESHPLATVLAEHGAALLTVIRAMANPDQPTPTEGQGEAGREEASSGVPTGYQPISVTVYE
jgi:hypothetical protein